MSCCVFQYIFRLDQETGLKSLQYQLESKRHLSIDGAPVHMYDVRLKCNYEKTPWCMTPADYKVVKDAKSPNGRRVPKNPKIFEDAKKRSLFLEKLVDLHSLQNGFHIGYMIDSLVYLIEGKIKRQEY